MPTRTISFSGRDWTVTSSPSKRGPGPNRFSDSEEDVWTDSRGLHLATSKKEGVWWCAEAVLDRPLDYGEYSFEVETPLAELDSKAVFSGFLYESDEREIDIEFSHSMIGRDCGQYAVQPGRKAGNAKRFAIPHGGASKHSIFWTPEFVFFESEWTDSAAGPAGIAGWNYSGTDNPKPGRARFIFNLWLYKGMRPVRRDEVVVRSFSFRPL